MFDRSNAKNRVFEFDYHKMNMFEFVRCSKNNVRVCSIFDKMVYDPSSFEVGKIAFILIS